MNDSTIRIASLMQRSVGHGPGQRFIVWVQGCSLGCPGCFSPTTHAQNDGQEVQAQQLAALILATKNIEGITISGGEPFQQAGALAGLTSIVRGTGLTVMCYSGFTLTELKRKHCDDVERLLENLDILVDGRFVEAKATRLRWRGSSNQRIHWLSSSYDHLKELDDSTSDVEIIASAKAFTATGIWPPDFYQQLCNLTRGESDDATQTT